MTPSSRRISTNTLRRSLAASTAARSHWLCGAVLCAQLPAHSRCACTCARRQSLIADHTPAAAAAAQFEVFFGFHNMAPRSELLHRIALRSGLVLLTIFVGEPHSQLVGVIVVGDCMCVRVVCSAASVVPYFGDVLSLVKARRLAAN